MKPPKPTPSAPRLLLAGITLAFSCATIPVAQSAPTPTPTPWSGTPVVQPIIPPDSRGTNQSAFNNLAWQQFIALNWVADPNSPGQPDPTVPPSAFGTQGDTRPLVWETYKEASEVFQPNAATPSPWNATRALPAALTSRVDSSALKSTSRFGVKGLIGVSKFAGGPELDLSDFKEAFAGGAWLTAQAKMNNYLTLYEKRLNEDEFNYITTNQLYNAANQGPFAQTQGLNLPDGSAAFASYGTIGAIEIKAAWIELDDQSLWPLFKVSQAYVSYPSANGPTPPKLVTVGLVGLHIIRKTQNAQQFVWSTFEHVNNAPSTTDIQKQTLKAWYTYYNATCDPKSDYYKCVPNSQPTPGKDPYNAPIQVVRTTPISNTTANNIAALNTNTWATIGAANPKSVFLNYQLVNVLWPNNNTTIPPGATTPLTDGNAQPPQTQQPVANTVLETYHQKENCLACHTFAPIASTSVSSKGVAIKRLPPRPSPTPRRSPPQSRKAAVTAAATPTPPPGPLASDYSFLFSEASTPAPTATPGPAQPNKPAAP